MNDNYKMEDYFRAEYEAFLKGPVGWQAGHERPRVRHVQRWVDFESRLPHGQALDLENLEEYQKLWVWSDHHFGHKNIIRFSDRPFNDLDEMREHMVANHNDYVKPDDVCIFVGDFAFLPDEKANEILHRMQGYKILVIGNHDWNKKKVKKLHFDETHLIKHIWKDGMDFVFTHYPMGTDVLIEPFFNVHGHEHVAHTYTDTLQHFNVNVEFTGFRPKLFQDIVDQAEMRKESMGE